jgi:hypothetical protein
MALSLKPILSTVSRIVQAELRRQVPVGKTGNLKKSITVQAVETSDGLELREGFLTYGRFLDDGTKRYHKPNPKAKWNPRPGKGKGGIKPRYWTHLSNETTLRISKIITQEMSKQIKKELKRKI